MAPLFSLILCVTLEAQPDASTPSPSRPHDAVIALKRFVTAPGIRADVFAADPQVANPVAICLDERGRLFVCETYRQKRGVEDNRDHEEWVDDDLAAQTVQDRLAYFEKHLGENVDRYTQHEDRIRLLVDRDGNGRADVSYVYRGGFSGAVEGTGAGILVRKGTVYYTCIPRLWAFRDKDNDGRADEQLVLHEGYGVRVAFRGHDLHGLCLGPDGRIYFSIGDRGYHVKTRRETLADPESGAVFRCEPDGSRLEVFATGFRNPQELAFDEFGNLFTGDNNSDSGDLARWVHVLEGGDCGWRMAYQYLPDRGPWNRLRLWEPFFPGQPAFVMPPVANIGDGPAGIAYYPGTGLGDHYIGNFFMCDFRGEASQSGIRTFKLRPRGATFELIDREVFLWNCLATDVDFGPDGAVYVSDWVEGWDGTGKGRIYRLTDENLDRPSVVTEVRKILAEGMSKRKISELAKLLEHPDYRVRLEAQLELAMRNKVDVFRYVLDKSNSQTARMHCIWGVGVIARRTGKNAVPLKTLLTGLRDVDPLIRAASANMIGDVGYAAAANRLTNLLADRDPRVQYQAAIALGKLGVAKAADDLLDFAALLPDNDVAMRHAAVMGLASTATADELVAAKSNPAVTARMAALLALRRQRSAAIAEYLHDKDPLIVREAALAINDIPIEAALPALAAAVAKSSADDGFIRRVLNANFRIGGPDNARAVAEFAADTNRSAVMRNLALDMLANWTEPPPRDAVLGMWRPLKNRDPKIARDALQATLPRLLRAGLAIRTRSAQLAGTLGVGDAGPILTDMLWDTSMTARQRAGVMLALGNIKPDNLGETVNNALRDEEPRVRAAARIVLFSLQPDDSFPILEAALNDGVPLEQKSSLTLLANMANKQADAVIQDRMKQLVARTLADYLQVETLLAARRRSSNAEIQRLVEQYEHQVANGDELARYRVALAGGDAHRGEEIFRERVSLSCVRCHKVNQKGGAVGPDLTHVAKDKSREYLLESIVTPNKSIAKGYESVVLFTDDGRTITGILKGEDEDKIHLMSEDERLFSISKDVVEEREKGNSAMPDDLIKKLSLFDLRDLVEYLASLK